jgi:hypothetical protein
MKFNAVDDSRYPLCYPLSDYFKAGAKNAKGKIYANEDETKFLVLETNSPTLGFYETKLSVYSRSPNNRWTEIPI